MENKREKFLNYGYWLSFILLLLSIGMLAGYFYNDYQGEILAFVSKIQQEPSEEGDITIGCENMSLSGSVNCLVKKVRVFYKYNETDENIELTLEELKERGGDCWDYSKLYANAAEKLGFGYEFVLLPMGLGKKHAIVVIYSEEGYCIVDQRSVMCTEYGDEEKY